MGSGRGAEGVECHRPRGAGPARSGGVLRRGEAVRERPIIFSGPMVRALLDGRKTQTRRICREPLGQHPQCSDEWGMFDEDGDWFSVSAMNAELFWASPYGAP